MTDPYSPRGPQYPSYPGQPSPPPAYGANYPPPPPAGGTYPPPPQTGYYVPQYGPERPQPVKGLAIAAVALAGVYTLGTVISAFLAADALETWRTYRSNGRMPADASTGWDIAFGFTILSLIPAYILTCIWMYRARKNASLIAPQSRHMLPAGWAWGGWPCPVVNLWFPLVMLLQTLKATTGRSYGLILGFWWGFWIASWIPFMATFGFLPYELTDPISDTFTVMTAVTAGVTLIAFALWAATVLQVTVAQQPAIKSM